jgi:methylthioribose-1-phosphate isomerase
MTTYSSIAWVDGKLRLLDQRKLPHRTEYIDYSDYREVTAAIRDMVVRGAPAIGITGAYALALAALESGAESSLALLAKLAAAKQDIQASRPTGANLAWALDRTFRRAETAAADGASVAAITQKIIDEAGSIFQQDIEVNRAIGRNALPLVPHGASIIHHCNTGSLATAGYGTALGIIRTAHEQERDVHAYLDETRPRLQGAALSAWELMQLDIPHTIIVDGASGHLMRTRKIAFCVVGCDRVAANGDTANKIGTYNLALAAHAHGVPFYVAAPTSTIDLSLACGDEIPIEVRSAEEILTIGSVRIAPQGANACNFAFDVTPAQYISAIITERSIVYPPFDANLAKVCTSPRTL